jgi:hypothetical protein
VTRLPSYIANMLATIHLPPPEPGKRISLVALDNALAGVVFARRATIITELKRAHLI